MNDLYTFAASNYAFGLSNNSSNNFRHSQAAKTFDSRNLLQLQPTNSAPTRTPDGSAFYSDADGELVYAIYASGAIVSKQPHHVAVRTADGDYWFGTNQGSWFRVD